MSEWISVEDRLPSYYEPCIAFDSDLSVKIGFLNDWGNFYYFVFDDDRFEGPYKTFEVTHWMPLPPPPEAV